MPILRGLWLNIQLLVFCAIGALAVGPARRHAAHAAGPVFFPVRAAATTYTYLFRGLPLIIILYVLAFGVPGLRLTGTPSVFVLGGSRSSSPTVPTWPRCSAPGIESVHPSQRPAARSLGLTYRQTMRHVVLPQAVRRVAPALLNDLVSLQKDVGLLSLAGPIDAIRAAQIARAESFNFTPYMWRVPVRPARTAGDRRHRLGDAAAPRRRQSLGRRRVAMFDDGARLREVRKVFGGTVVLDDLT